MPRTMEQFGPNVVKKEPVVGATIPIETDVQSYLVSRDQEARLGAEAEKRVRDFNVWILSSPLYHEHDEDIPDVRKLREEDLANRKESETEARPIRYESFRYSELKYKLADVYPGYREVYSYGVPDLVVMYGGKGYVDNEPESSLSRSYRDNEMIPIRDIRKAADSVSFLFFSSGEKIVGDWAGEFLDMHVLWGKKKALIAENADVTADRIAELIATDLLGTDDRDWSILSRAFDEYSREGNEEVLAKAVTPGRVRRAVERSEKEWSNEALEHIFKQSDEDKENGFHEKALFDEHARKLVSAASSFADGKSPEALRHDIAAAFKRIVDERIGEYQADIEFDAAEERLLQPIVVAVGPSIRFRDRAIEAGADATLPALAESEIGKLTSLAARMRSSPASIARERLRRNKSDVYRGVESEIESRSELTADTEKELSILASLLEKTGAKNVLDVGCGYGRLARPLAEKGFEVTGIDANRSLLEMAKEAKGKRRNLHYKKGDIIEYRDAVKGGSYDAVYYGWHSFLEAHGLGNALASLRSAYAALRQGGVLTFDQPSRENPGMEDGSYGDEAHGYFAYLMDEGELDLMLRLAGFEDLHIHRWTTKPSALYPEGMKKWTVVATKPEIKESEDKWWLAKDDFEEYGRPIVTGV